MGSLHCFQRHKFLIHSMDGMNAVLLLIALVAYAAGLATYQWILVRRRTRIIKQGQKEASDFLAQAETDINSLRTQALTEARGELEEDRRSLESARAALEQEREEIHRSQRKFRNRLDRRHSKLNSRTSKLHQRETVLDKAGRAIKQLQRETEKTARETEQLRARAESLESEAAERNSRLDEELALTRHSAKRARSRAVAFAGNHSSQDLRIGTDRRSIVR